jgi:hypothetical protein
MRYLYISCVGNEYDLGRGLTFKEMCCEQCGDMDNFIGTYETKEEREELLNKHYDWQ